MRKIHAKEDPAGYASGLHLLGLLFSKLSEFDKADPLFQQELEVLATIPTFDSFSHFNSLLSLASQYQSMAAYDRAEPLLLKATELYAKAQGMDRLHHATSLDSLAVLYQSMGEFAKAEPLFLEAKEIRGTAIGRDQPLYAHSLQNLAALYVAMGSYHKAEPLLLQARAVDAKTLGPKNPGYAEILDKLGGFYREVGAYDKSETWYLQARETRANTVGLNHPAYATSLHNLANLYSEMGAYAKAERLFLQVQEIDAKAFGGSPPAESLSSLAFVYLQKGAFEKAEPLLAKALALKTRNAGHDPASHASILRLLAGLHLEMGACEKAEPLFQRALQIVEKAFGRSHPEYADCLTGLAGLYFVMGSYEKAEPLYLQAAEILARSLGENHPSYARVLANAAELYLAMKTPAAAIPLVRRTNRIHRALLERIMGAFPEQDRESYVRKLTLFHLPCCLEDGPLAAESLLAFKGAIGASLLEEQRLLRASDRPEAAEKIERLHSLRNQCYRATLQGQLDRAEILFTGIENAEKEVSRLVSGLGAARKSLHVQTSEVQAKIPASAALIELIRYRRPLFDRKESPWESRYGAAVIRREGNPVFVRLTLAEGIDSEVHRFRQLAESTGKDEGCILASRELYRLLLGPLESAIGDAKTLIICPDSQLHFLSFEPLLDSNDLMACEKWNIRMIDNGRDLLEVPGEAAQATKTALIVGDPDFNARTGTRGKRASLSGQSNGSSKVAPTESVSQFASSGFETPEHRLERSLASGLSSDLRNFAFSRLPGTADEITALQEKLKDLGFTTLELRRDQASESAVAASIKRQHLVHFATHGFFLNELNIGDEKNLLRFGADFTQATPAKSAVRISDPMLRSGLALAGANLTLAAWQKGEVPDPRNDGILTAAEAVNLDLNGTKLVVLSACETAKGKALDGEGIYGMRRALKMAGADAVVMTLWPVNDEYTVEFMNDFYARCLGGKHPAVALAETKRKLLISLKAKNGFHAAVQLAGPFIATGKGVAAVE